MKLAVIGSRGFTNYSKLKEYLDSISGISEIVSGAAAGADSLATQYAIENSIPVKELPADYKTFGVKAPHIRNDQIIAYCDAMIAFWDGKSPGTKSVIKKAQKVGKLHSIVTFT